MIALIPFRIEFEVYGAILSPLDLIVYFLFLLSIIKYFLLPKKVNGKYLILFSMFYLLSIPFKILLLHPKGLLQGIWHIFRNIFEPLPLIFLVIILNVRDKKTLKKAILILLTFSAISSIIGIIQTVSGGRYLTGIGVYGNFKFLGIYPPFPPDSDPLGKEHLGKISSITHVPNTDIFRAHGGLNRHNYFAAFLVLVATITFSLALSGSWKLYCFFILQITALIFTFTRAAYVGFFFSLIFFFFLKNPFGKLFKYIFSFVTFILILFILVPMDFKKHIFHRFETILNATQTIEMKARFRAYEITIKEIEKNPIIGHGGGGIKKFEIMGYPLSPHNDILDIIYSRGFIVFFIIYFMYLFILRDSFKIWKRTRDSLIRGYSLGFFCGFLGILITGLAQPIVTVPDTSALIWLTIGISVSILYIEANLRKE